MHAACLFVACCAPRADTQTTRTVKSHSVRCSGASGPAHTRSSAQPPAGRTGAVPWRVRCSTTVGSRRLSRPACLRPWLCFCGVA
jgi:hypothetical protein